MLRQPTDELTAALKRMQVPSSECADLYLQILRDGSIADRDLTDVAKESAYWLEQVGFVFSEVEGSDRVFYPTEPDFLATSLKNRHKWGLPPFGRPDNEDEGPKQKDIDILHRCSKLLIADSAQLKRIPKNFIFLEGTDRISNFIVRMIEQASEFFGMSATEWASNLPLIWAALVNRINSGLRYRRLAGESAFVAFGHEINKRDVLEVGVDLRILQEARLNPIFYLATTADSDICLTFNDVQARLAGRREATSFTNQTLVARFREIAEANWRAAVPAVQMFTFMDGLREVYLCKVRDRLGSEGREVAARIFDLGIFADFRDCDTSVRSLLERLEREGFVLQRDVGIGVSNFMPSVLEEVSSFVAENAHLKEA